MSRVCLLIHRNKGTNDLEHWIIWILRRVVFLHQLKNAQLTTIQEGNDSGMRCHVIIIKNLIICGRLYDQELQYPGSSRLDLPDYTCSGA